MGYEKLTGGKAKVGGFNIAGVDLTATATELNQLHGQGAVAADLAKLHALTATAAELNQLHGVQAVKVAKVPLAFVANTGGGLGAWTNPESGSVLIDKVLVDVTTVATAAALVDVGTTASNATTISDNLMDGIDVHSAVALLALADQAGANGKSRQKLASGKWVTFSTQAGGSDDATGLVGNAYIYYTVA